MSSTISSIQTFSLYYKHKSVGEFGPLVREDEDLTSTSVRTILSSRYKGKLADFAKSFSDQKAELQYLTQQKAAVTVTAMKGNLETVSTQVEKIFALLDMKSSDEKKAAEFVLAAGGEAMVLNVGHIFNLFANHLTMSAIG